MTCVKACEYDMSVGFSGLCRFPSSVLAHLLPFPQELTAWQQVFLDFYLKKYSGRRLQWYNSLSSCLLVRELLADIRSSIS